VPHAALPPTLPPPAAPHAPLPTSSEASSPF
jgi:hypothetical protein